MSSFRRIMSKNRDVSLDRDTWTIGIERMRSTAETALSFSAATIADPRDESIP
ncbi:MAG: hypothetical protein ABSG21_12925 [Spirochaetia bacterium]|jgi:hypothetical protein